LLASLAAVSVVVACASREELVAKSAEIPAGVDLSGQWRLRADSRDTVARISDAEIAAAGGTESIIVPPKRGTGKARRHSSDGALVHVFLETGMALKVTQTDSGLFISFDRSVVEEYRFGEKRQISVGPVEADRVSGWEGNAYIIETLDADGAKLIESYRLHDEGRSLVRTIAIVAKGQTTLDVRQVFDRA
jgi:hypothetical protein